MLTSQKQRNYLQMTKLLLHLKEKKIVSEALYQKSQRKRMNFEKLLGQQVFKNLNCNPFQPCFVIYQYLLLMFLAVTQILQLLL